MGFTPKFSQVIHSRLGHKAHDIVKRDRNAIAPAGESAKFPISPDLPGLGNYREPTDLHWCPNVRRRSIRVHATTEHLNLIVSRFPAGADDYGNGRWSKKQFNGDNERCSSD